MEQGCKRHALWILLRTALLSLPITAVASGASSTIAHLPNVKIYAAKVDASGKIYIAGQITTPAGFIAAYISKLSSDGATTYYAATLGGGGTSTSAVTALDIDSAGAVYVAGTTTAVNFPVSPGAVQSSGATAFAAKLDAQGNVVYSALIGGNAMTAPSSVVVNTQGELVVSGETTPAGSMPAAPALFLLKLSANGGTVVTGPQGAGGLLAADSSDNIYIAGAAPSGSATPVPTPGAFQGIPSVSYCGCPFFGFPCAPGNQFVASITPDLSQTRFLTYVTSQYGALPASIAVDGQGNVLVTGTTSSPGYPTTNNSYLPTYTAASGVTETCGPPIALEFTSPSGYVTLVKSDGTGLIFSTFFSGSNSDSIDFAAWTSAGIYIAGLAGSTDLPGFNGAVPSQCGPVGFVTRMTTDGSAISATRTPQGTPLAYDSTTGTLLLFSGDDLFRFDPSQATPIACVLDSADLQPVTSVAPGELVTLFGRFLIGSFEANPFAPTIQPVNGMFPVTWQGLDAMANQIPAPLLYVSNQQVNLQAPYEIAGSLETNLSVTYSDVNGNTISDSRTLGVVASNPVAFLSQPSYVDQTFPLTLNADGTVNSSTNPAAAGSIVTIFLDGLGVTSPQPITGLVNTSPGAPLNLPVVVTPNSNAGCCYPAPAFVSASSLPGSISGVTQVQLHAPANPNSGGGFETLFSLSVGSAAVRDMNLSFWLQ